MRIYEDDKLMMEYGLKRGKKHGTQYEWYEPGRLCSAEPYVNGVPHGIARQWAPDGRLIGTYRLNHGCGLDLWRDLREDGSIFLSEAAYWRKLGGITIDWLINEDQKTIWREYLRPGERGGGIEREWNDKGRLRRGYPEYYANGRQVSKRQYAAACKKDPALPPLRPEDDKPQRTFPPEVARHLRFPKRVRKRAR